MAKVKDFPQWIWQQKDWPQFIWQAGELADLLKNINALQASLYIPCVTISPAEELAGELDALLQNAINTSAIEGERLDVYSVRSSLARRLGVAQAGLPPGTPKSEGLADLLLDATRNPGEALTMTRLCRWHRQLFPEGGTLVNPVRAGELRGSDPMQVVSGPINKPRVHFEAPPRAGLEAALEAFVNWFNTSRKESVDPFIRAGLAHLWFVTLHPFDDGNGRLARAISDLALAQAEGQSIRLYAMSATIMAHRNTYYEVLETTQRDGMDVTSWLCWFLNMVNLTLQDARMRIDYVLKKSRFWQRHAQTVLSERQVKVLNRLLDEGPGGFEGGINARKYMSLTQVSKATATRDLADLLHKECLCQRSGGGRSTSYDIDWG